MGKVTQDDLVNVDDLIQQSKDSGDYVDVNSLIADGTIQKKNPSGNGLNQPSPSQSQSPLQSGSVKTFDEPALKLSDGGVPVENGGTAPSKSDFLNQPPPQATPNQVPQNISQLPELQKPASESTKAIQPEQSLQDEQAKENSKQREATVKKELPVAYKNTAKQYFESQKIAPTSTQLQQKVDELKQEKENGNLVIGHDSQGNPRMERNVGGFEGLWLGVKQGFKAEGEARKFQDMSEEDRIKFMNDKLNNDKEYLPANTQFTPLGALGQSIGGGAPLVAETAAGATIGGLLTAAAPETGGLSLEGLAPTLAFIFSAQGAANVGYMDEYIKRFKDAKDEGLSDADAYKKVGNLPLIGEATSLATNAFLSRIPVSKATGEGITSAIDQYLKSGIKSSTEFAGASAVGNTASELTAKAAGFNKDKSVGDIALESGQQAFEAGLTGLALHAITHPETYTALPKYVRAQLKGYLSKANPIEVAEAMDEMAQKGFANQDDADKAKGKFKSYIDANKSVPPNLDETKSAVITGLIEKKKSLEAEKQKLDPAFHSDLDKQIADIDGKINLAKNSDNPLQFESDDLTGQHNLNPKTHDELTAKEKEGIKVPPEYGGIEVEEVGGKGEDAETKYKPTAYVTENKGSLELKQPIDVGDKTYSDKQKAQEAADKALKQHYYENGLHESGKPQKKQQDNGLQLQKEEETSKVTEPATAGAGGETAPAETEATVNEKPLSRDEVKSLHDNLTPEQKQEYLDQELEGKGDEYLKSLNNGKTLPNTAAEEKPKEEPQAEVIQPEAVEGNQPPNEKATEEPKQQEKLTINDLEGVSVNYQGDDITILSKPIDKGGGTWYFKVKDSRSGKEREVGLIRKDESENNWLLKQANKSQPTETKSIEAGKKQEENIQGEDYKGQHQLAEFKTTANDLENGGTGFDWKYVSQDHDLTDKATKESYRILKTIKDNPESEVTVYRSVPKNVDKINDGDWVTLSKTYANDHDENAKVISTKVKAKDIAWDGNDLNEFSYKPKPNQEQGAQESDTTKKPQGTESQAPKKEQQKPEKQKDNSVVDVKPFKKGDGGTKGVFEGKDGKLYKSVQPLEITKTDKGFERKPIEGQETDEHAILSDLQGNPHIPKVGKLVETSEGKAFEIEKLNEVDKFTKDEYRKIQTILNDLNDKGYHVGDKVTVMKRPKTGELVVVDFSSGYKGDRMSRDADDYMQDIKSKLSKSDAIDIEQEDSAASDRKMAESLLKKESTTEYYLTQRPPSIGTHPIEGLSKQPEQTEFRGRKAWLLSYDRKLSKNEIYNSELTPKITDKEFLGQKISGVFGKKSFYVKDVDYKNGKVKLVSELDGKEIEIEKSFKEFQRSLDDGKYKIEETEKQKDNSVVGSENKVSKDLNVNKDVNLTPDGKKTSDKEQAAAANTNEGGGKVGKGNQEEKIKTYKKRAKPTIKSPLYKKALDIEDESPRAQTLKYFINGGKIHTDALKELFGNKRGKNVNAELNAKLQLRGKDAPKTIDALAHKLWDNSPEEIQNKYDSQDFRNAIEDVLQSHNSRTSMAEEMVNTMSVDEKAMSDWYDKTYSVAEKDGVEEEDLNHAIDILEGLSDEEIQKIADEQPNAYGSHEYIKKVMELHGVEDKIKQDQSVEQAKQAYNVANSNHQKAVSDLSKAQDKIAKEQASQQDIFRGTQKGMLGGVSGDEAKSILEPLKAKVKEAKAALDEADKNWENAVSRSQPTLDINTETDTKIRNADKGGLKATIAGVMSMVGSHTSDAGKDVSHFVDRKAAEKVSTEIPDEDYLKTIKVSDNREVDATSGKPMTDKNQLNSVANVGTARQIIRAANKYDVDPYTMLAIAFQETGIAGAGETEGNPLHLIDNRAYDLIDEGAKLFKEKMKIADSRGKKTEEERIQAFNGYGKVGKHTEGQQKSLYGIDVSKEPIDMNKNPVYGKRIVDIRDNIIKKNPELVKLVEGERGNVLYDRSNASLKDDRNVGDYVAKAKSVLETLYPKAKLEVYDNTKDYVNAGGDEYTRGIAFSARNGNHRILLNLEQIKNDNSGKTAFHEVIHPIVFDAFGVKKEDLIPIWNKIATEMEKVKGMEKVFDHVSAYPKDIVAAEGLTELLTQVAAGNIDLSSVPRSTGSKIIDLINKLFDALGINITLKSVEDFHNIANRIKTAFDTGSGEALRDIIKGHKIDKYVADLAKSKDISPEQYKEKIEKLKSLGYSDEDIKAAFKRKGIAEEKVNEILSQTKTENDAIKEGEQPEGNIPEHQDRESGGQAAETSGSNSSVGSGEKQQGQKEVGGEPPTPKTKAEGEEGGSSIIHERTAETRKEFGLGEYQKTPETFAKWDAEAEQRIKDGEMPDVIKKLKKGLQPDEVEQRMMGKYVANLETNASADPSNENLSKLKEAIELSDRIGGSEVGKSLVARKGTHLNDESLASYMLNEMDAAKVDELTPEQKAKVEKEWKDIQTTKKQFDEYVQKKEAELAEREAKVQVNKTKATTNKNTKKTHDDYVKEREQIFTDIKDKLRKARGQASATIVPYANELIAIAPDVGKLMKSLVEEGVDKLEDIVKNIHGQLGEVIPQIQEKDVQDIIAGNYNKKKLTRNETVTRIRDLQTEAGLINQYEALERGEEPKIEKKKVERNKKLTELRKQIKEHDLTQLATYKSRTEAEVEKLKEQLKKGDFARQENKQKLQLDKQGLELKDKLIKLRQEREIRLLKEKYSNRDTGQKITDAILEVANVPRAIMSSMDFSAPLRQGLIPTISHPLMASKAAIEMFKQAGSQKAFDRWFFDIKESPRYELAKESKLYLADPHDPILSAKEEQFMTNLAEKIPYIGKASKIPFTDKKIGGLIKGSERAYLGYLNKMRWDLWNRAIDAFEKDGKTFDNSQKLYEAMADYINASTGRGSLGRFDESAKILNAMFFSPRLIASRLKLLTNPINPYFYARVPKAVKVQYFKDMATFIGVGLGVLALAKLNGATVEDDPRSSDFGKVKVGDTRYDIWGGFQQYIRLVAQLFTGQRKTTTTGQIQELKADDKAQLMFNFARGKLSPVPATAIDVISGEDIVGNEITPANKAESILVPMIANDVADAMKDSGVRAIFTVGVPAAFGVGVQTYNRASGKTDLKSLVEKNMDSHRIDADTIKKVDDKGGEHEISKAEFNKYVALRDSKIKAELEKIHKDGVPVVKDGAVVVKPFKEVTANELADEIRRIKSEATRESKDELFPVPENIKHQRSREQKIMEHYRKTHKEEE